MTESAEALLADARQLLVSICNNWRADGFADVRLGSPLVAPSAVERMGRLVGRAGSLLDRIERREESMLVR